MLYNKLMARRPLYEKNEAYKRTVRDTISERDSGHGRLIDLANRNQVHVWWGFSDQATADGVFRIKIGDKEAVLDAEQMLKFLRWV